ncbi:MAG TPA: protein translocase subunit SecF [Terriglobales bacterium]|nr:protein translocase subunit SecF [Terriglobales bacterium]
MMELFRDINIDWIGKSKFYFAFSGLVVLLGIYTFFFGNKIPQGVDFKPGTIVYVKFSQAVSAEQIRSAVHNGGVKDARIQGYGKPENNEYIVALETAPNEQALDSGKQAIVAALNGSPLSGKFEVRKAEIVGPQVGDQLKKQAFWATVYSLGGMLVYLAFRFEFIYGMAAVIAVLHDTWFTLMVFSLTNTELSLTVIAALLTLIGYSMNDTIVIFDRIRENLKISRRESLVEVVNKSINQTLSRTILTSGLTFLTVLSLYLFGGEVLHGFSFALVIGILIGTYSSIAVAAPVLVAYDNWKMSRSGRSAVGRSESRDSGKRDKAVRA